jgi:site-specific DNA-adenine methylase
MIHSPFSPAEAQKTTEHVVGLIPQGLDLFVDLFCGGCPVSVNAEARRAIANTHSGTLASFYEFLKSQESPGDFVDEIQSAANSYGGLETDWEFQRLRRDFAKTRDWVKLALLFASCWKNELLFNRRSECVSAFGPPDGSPRFGEGFRDRMLGFTQALRRFEFTNVDFTNFLGDDPEDFVEYPEKTFFWAAPGRLGLQSQRDLVELLDGLGKLGFKYGFLLKHRDISSFEGWIREKQFGAHSLFGDLLLLS